jgi:two-component system sensor kinase FixL
VDELKEINEQLNQFAYVASHDLKAPLRAISSLADWLSEDYADKIGPAGQEQFLLLQGRVKRMSALIEGILRYSRISRQQEKKILVDVNLLLPEVKELVAPPAGMELRIAPGFPRIMTERVRLLQVFENLVSNAVKYMGKPTGQIYVGWEDAGNFWTFYVRDTGLGIDQKYFEKIFQIFQTLTPRDERESTGIGLALVKKNVEILEGRVWVESKLGEGSTFFFSHPKASAVELQPGSTNKSRA